MTPAFYQSRLKLHWADHHVAQLQTHWDGYLKTDFCEIIVESQPKRDNSFVVGALGAGTAIKVKAKPLPAEIPLIIGDAVHNLKCALDYCINEIMHWRSGRIGFPVHAAREQLVDSFRTEPQVIDGKTKKAGANAPIARAVDGLADFILDEIKPYAGEDSLLWAISRLDNTDKHRTLTVMAAPHTVFDIRAVDDHHNSVQYTKVSIGAGGILTLGGSDGPGFKIESHGRIAAEILFNEAGVVQGQPVIPTLMNMLQRAAETIDRIEEFVIAAGWTPAE